MTDQPQATPHEQFEAALPELALGVLDGRERAGLLGHVDTCASCAAELEQLTETADSLVHLAAEVDPPVGFETRLFDRLQVGPSAVGIHRGWRRRSLLVTAAAAAVAAAFGVGWMVHSTNGSPVHSAVVAPVGGYRLAQASLVSSGKPVGSVSVYSGTPGWLSMTVGSSTWTGTVRCTVTSTDGATHTVASFDLAAGRGAWDAPLPVAAGTVASAQLVAADGRVLATARLS